MEETPNVDGSVCNTINMEEGIPRDFPTSSAHNEMLKDVRSHLSYRESTEQETENTSRHQKRKRREGEKNEQRRRSPSQASSRSASVFSHLGAKRQEQKRKDARELIQSYATYSSERQWENEREYQRREREESRDEPLESKDSSGRRH
ncbi:hypothetical protein Tco_0687468 [Tanacetum coccineum]